MASNTLQLLLPCPKEPKLPTEANPWPVERFSTHISAGYTYRTMIYATASSRVMQQSRLLLQRCLCRRQVYENFEVLKRFAE